MSTKNLSHNDTKNIKNASAYKIGIAVAEWNKEVTDSLCKGAINTLQKFGVWKNNIITVQVPGTFELTKAGKYFAEQTKVDAVILLGCVIQGETRHFDFICEGVTNGITNLNLNYDIPFIFGVLTTQNQEQALARSGGKLGNKGDEAAIAAIKMIQLKNELN